MLRGILLGPLDPCTWQCFFTSGTTCPAMQYYIPDDWSPHVYLIIKPTRFSNFSNLFLEWNFTCFRQFLWPSSGVFYRVPSWSCSQAVSKPVWHIPLLCVQWKTPDDGWRNCPKHVELHSKNKFENLVHPVGFIIRNLTWCTVTWTSNSSFIPMWKTLEAAK